MPMVGSGDRDGVHVFLFQNCAKVFFRGRGLAHLALRRIGELLQDVAVHVADVRNARGALVSLQR